MAAHRSRTRDPIEPGGGWIGSVDPENALMGHPAVREAAVIAVPQAKWGERPPVAATLKDGVKPCEEELRAHLAERFSRWQMPEALVFVARIPRTSVGKFQKSRLREMFAGFRHQQAAAGNSG